VYNRPVQFRDQSNVLELGDFAWIRAEQPHVLLMSDIAAANAAHKGDSGLSFNEVQLRVLARASHVITVQGGPAVFSSYFTAAAGGGGGGGEVVVLHRQGQEVRHNEYDALFARFAGARHTVTRSEEELVGAVQARAPLWRQALSVT
jgi:hypothetical protein